MKFLGFDVTFAYNAVSDVYHLMKAYKKMSTKKKDKNKKEEILKETEIDDSEIEEEKREG